MHAAYNLRLAAALPPDRPGALLKPCQLVSFIASHSNQFNPLPLDMQVISIPQGNVALDTHEFSKVCTPAVLALLAACIADAVVCGLAGAAALDSLDLVKFYTASRCSNKPAFRAILDTALSISLFPQMPQRLVEHVSTK